MPRLSSAEKSRRESVLLQLLTNRPGVGPDSVAINWGVWWRRRCSSRYQVNDAVLAHLQKLEQQGLITIERPQVQGRRSPESWKIRATEKFKGGGQPCRLI